ncbi:MAG: extracellular solute-binding protein [Firmicutes bacterium]|nr:extracellular solute-binding protein [Bacillota bacterium]
MKKTMAIKNLGLSMALILVMMVSGCGKNGEKKVTVNENANFPDTLTIFAPVGSFLSSQGLDNNGIIGLQLLEERTGTHVEWEHPNSNALEEKFNLMVASGKLPDLIVYYWNSRNARAHIDEGIILPLRDLVAANMPNLTAFNNERPEVRRQYTDDDGEIAYIPFIRKDKELGIYLGPIIREDWLDNLGLPIPKTTDELYAVLKAFKEGDPNGNGIADEIPMTGTGFGSSQFGIGNLAGAFGTNHNFYLDNGVIKYGILEDSFKEALQYISKLFSEGLIDNDYLLTDRNKMDAKAMGDRAGFLFGFQPSIYQRNMDDGVRKFTGIPHLRGPHGDNAYFVSAYANAVATSSVAVTAANKQPEATMRWIDEFFGEPGLTYMNFGKEGLTFNMENGYPRLTDYVLNNPDGKSINEMLSISVAAYESAFPTLQDFKYYEQYLSDWGREAINNWSEDVDVSGVLPLLSFTESESDTVTQIMAQVETFVSEEINKIVLGRGSIGDLPAIRERVKSMGIERVLSIYNDAYARYLKR